MNRLVIISHTPHYQSNGTIVGWGPTIKENDYIAKLFKEVVVVGFLHSESAPASAIPYSQPNIKCSLVKAAGGDSLLDKLKLILTLPYYGLKIHRNVSRLKPTDWVYVRSPCNIALVACLYFVLKKEPKRWFKFAGNWNLESHQPMSYQLQKWLLNKNLPKGDVTINGKWPHQPLHVHSFLNPCITQSEYEQAVSATQSKTLSNPIHLLFVGRIEREKGVFFIADILEKIKDELNQKIHITFIGQDIHTPELKQKILSYNLSAEIEFRNQMPHSEIGNYYTKSHFILLPSASEGWPKVISEAMAYKCVPITSNVSSIPQILEQYQCGISLSFTLTDWVQQLLNTIRNPAQWENFAKNGQHAAQNFTYETITKQLSQTILKES